MDKLLNPPDLAVALHYNGQSAPRVIASGRGGGAEQIMELARQHNVLLHADQELARILSTIPVGGEIPEKLYLAIAEIIAFAYLLSGKVPANHDNG